MSKFVHPNFAIDEQVDQEWAKKYQVQFVALCASLMTIFPRSNPEEIEEKAREFMAVKKEMHKIQLKKAASKKPKWLKVNKVKKSKKKRKKSKSLLKGLLVENHLQKHEGSDPDEYYFDEPSNYVNAPIVEEEDILWFTLPCV